MNRRHVPIALLPLVLSVGVLSTGCDETGPLVRTGTLAGVVRDSAAAYVSGVPVGVIYDVPTPPMAKHTGSVLVTTGLRSRAAVGARATLVRPSTTK